MQKRVAEENLMLASNKKRQFVTQEVQDAMKAQKDVTAAKISYSTMIR
jgi:hypothetical protein